MLFTGIEKFEIMAIPFFILAGVVVCVLFAAVSGSCPATVVAIGSIIMPAMVRQGYLKGFGAGVVTTSGALGILIPPSIVMVMYSVSTNTSVGKLFMAGVVPGILLAAFLGPAADLLVVNILAAASW